jgi:hypothetical protein
MISESSGLLDNFFRDAAIRPEKENGRRTSHVSAVWPICLHPTATLLPTDIELLRYHR